MTGQHRPGRWPRYALWALEDTQANLLDIGQKAREAQEALRQGRTLDAVILLGDIRNLSMDGRNTLHKSKEGER